MHKEKVITLAAIFGGLVCIAGMGALCWEMARSSMEIDSRPPLKPDMISVTEIRNYDLACVQASRVFGTPLGLPVQCEMLPRPKAIIESHKDAFGHAPIIR